jgi:hypothetical protein
MGDHRMAGVGHILDQHCPVACVHEAQHSAPDVEGRSSGRNNLILRLRASNSLGSVSSVAGNGVVGILPLDLRGSSISFEGAAGDEGPLNHYWSS